MSKPRLLIANSSPEFCRSMAAAFRDFADTNCCCSGRQALSQLRAQPYQLMLLDLSLPELDGLTVLRTAQAEDILPATLVTLDLRSPYVSNALSQLRISYAMVHPCEPEAIVANMLDIAASLPNAPILPVPNERDAVTELLLKLRFNPNHGGFAYFVAAVPLFAQDPGQFVTKELYTTVGKPFGKSMQQVERSMRVAVEKAWACDDTGIWQKYFPGMTAKPANKVFIAAMARLLFPADEQNAV